MTLLIRSINEELLKSAELTGLWEKKLRQIEKGQYEARLFLEELKQMVSEIVQHVLCDRNSRAITIEEAVKESVKKEKKPRTPRAGKEKKAAKEAEEQLVCPVCKKGRLLRGKTAYGCSGYREGCTFRLDYETYGEGLTDGQLKEIIDKLK